MNRLKAPVRAMLSSTLMRDNRSLFLALFRGGYLLIALPIVMGLLQSLPVTAAGVKVAWGMEFQLAAFFCIGLAHYLGSESAGDSRTGVLELIAISGVTRLEWIIYRLAQCWINFLSVWVIRIPVLAFLGTFGGMTVDNWLFRELLLLLMFAVGSTISFVGSYSAPTRQKAWGALTSSVFFIEFASVFPTLVLRRLVPLLGVAGTGPLSQAEDFLSTFGFVACVQAAHSGTPTPSQLIPTAVIYGVICVGALIWLHQRIFVRIEPQVQENFAKRAKRWFRRETISRPSRRCWDRPLVWQAFAYHGPGISGVIAKASFHAIVAVGLGVAYWFGFREFVLVLMCAWCIAFLLHGIHKPADCMNRELREQTLTSLQLAPFEMTDFYNGWRTGGWILAIPDLVVAGIVSVLVTAMLPETGVIIVTISVGMMVLGPLQFLSVVLPWSIAGFFTGAIIICVIAATVIAGIFVGLEASPWLVPVVAWPILGTLTWVVRQFVIPKWIQRKLSTDTVN